MPVPDIRIDWRGDGFSAITNEAFLVDTTGWSVAAGINAAGTSITRATGDGVLGGVATNTAGELVTTAVSGSGANFDFGATTFTIGRTYRFSVWLKSVSGSTAARILVGSLGTVGDRAASTPTLTTAWVRYSVDWTPSATRTDVEAIVTNNAAAIATMRISLAEAYEAIDDIGPAGGADVTALSWSRGANFDGSAESPGTCTMTVTNLDQRYSPDNTGSDLSGLLATGKQVLVRAIDGAFVHGSFYGLLRRLVPLPESRTAELLFEDRLYDLARREVSLAVSLTRSIQTFRGAVLDDAGFTATTQRSLASGSPELHTPQTGADQVQALGVLAECNLATGSIHYCDPHPVPSVGWRYTTVDRTMLQTAASAASIVDTVSPGVHGLSGYDVTDEAVINDQRVSVATRVLLLPAVVWEVAEVPFTVDATITMWATFPDPTFSQALTYTATNSPTVTLTAFDRSAKIVITPGAATTISALSIVGRTLTTMSTGSERSTTGAADRRGSDIASDLIDTRAVAKGLADWAILRYGTDKARPDLTVHNDPQALTLDIGDTLELTFGLLSISGKRYIVRSLSTTVQTNALEWVTTYGLEAGLPDTLLFTVGGTAAEGVGGTGVLAT